MAVADITSFQTKKKDMDLVEGGALFDLHMRLALTATAGDDGEFILAGTVPADLRVINGFMNVDATLGSAVIALYHNDGTTRTAMTADTGAGAAHLEEMNIAPFDVAEGDTFEIEVETADISAAANVDIDLIVYRR